MAPREDIIKLKRRPERNLRQALRPHPRGSRKTLDRDHFMNAEEAKAWGIVDHVYETREAAEAAAK